MRRTRGPSPSTSPGCASESETGNPRPDQTGFRRSTGGCGTGRGLLEELLAWYHLVRVVVPVTLEEHHLVRVVGRRARPNLGRLRHRRRAPAPSSPIGAHAGSLWAKSRLPPASTGLRGGQDLVHGNEVLFALDPTYHLSGRQKVAVNNTVGAIIRALEAEGVIPPP